MNIAVNGRVLIHNRLEGVGRYIKETTRAMVAAHPEDQFYIFFDRPYHDSFVFADNVHPVVVPPQARHPLLWYVWFEWMLPRMLKKYNIDVFYSGDSYLSKTTNVPTMIVSHDLAYLHYPDHIPARARKYYHKNFPDFHRQADRIVAVSQFTKHDIIRQYGIAEDRIDVAYNAVPQGFRKYEDGEVARVRARYTGGCPYFIYVGSLHPRKNVKNLIHAFDAFKQAYESDHKLVLVGRYAWNHAHIKEAYDAAAFRKDIIFTGALFEEVKELVPASEALLYVSLFEGFGIPILEGFASEVPVITSTVSSMPEVAGNAAILVDPEDILAIAKAMQSVRNPSKRKSLVELGKERLKDFDWNKSAEIIYQGLCEINHKTNLKS